MIHITVAVKKDQTKLVRFHTNIVIDFSSAPTNPHRSVTKTRSDGTFSLLSSNPVGLPRRHLHRGPPFDVTVKQRQTEIYLDMPRTIYGLLTPNFSAFRVLSAFRFTVGQWHLLTRDR